MTQEKQDALRARCEAVKEDGKCWSDCENYKNETAGLILLALDEMGELENKISFLTNALIQAVEWHNHWKGIAKNYESTGLTPDECWAFADARAAGRLIVLPGKGEEGRGRE